MSFFLHAYFPQNLHFYIDICNDEVIRTYVREKEKQNENMQKEM